MNASTFLMAVVLCLLWPLAARSDEPADSTPAATQAADDARLQELIEKLASNQYVQREIASLELARIGARAVPALAAAVQQGDLEMTERAMQLLQRVALAEKPLDPPQGWNAIVQLAEKGSGTSASRAQAAMRAISLRRQAMAREQLAGDGIAVGLSNVVMEASSINEEVVHIPDTWEGELETLDWLAWLHGVQYIAVEGPAIDRDLLQRVTKMPDLKNIVITNTNVKSDDLAPLTELKRIDQLEIRYTPVDDQAIELLKKLPIRQKLILNGTQITPEGFRSIRSQLPGVQIVYKRGGFLGVRCDPFAPRCQVTLVIEGGAAQQAGMRTGDTVTKVGQKPIGRFADLQAAIGEYAPGEEIPITVDRGGQAIQLVAKLGTMQSEDN
ncbi:PDZ domain-containing protein [Roseimaritima ulvae]|uniref:PDZ domain-containing protein n=1 Tax=Roseimaritima ulvae TaxID=980254 RepID=UPI00138FE33B|nr:PDZ domain-containing protein [Roseimaritima ulvae]